MIIEPTLVEQVWPFIWKLIEKLVVLETEEELLADLKNGNRIMMIIGDGVGIGYAQGKLFKLDYVAGKKLNEWWPQMDAFVDVIAKGLGCETVMAFGRKGWEKKAPNYTATKQQVYLRKVA